MILRTPAEWFEGHLVIYGRHRPPIARLAHPKEKLPIGITEHVQHHADYYDDLYEATIREAMQGSLMQVYTAGIEDDSRERLLRNFKIIQLRQPQPAAFPLKSVDLGTLSAVRQQVNYELGMSSGAIGYARGVPMNVEYATEAAMIGQNASIRMSRLQDYLLQFVETCLENSLCYSYDGR